MKIKMIIAQRKCNYTGQYAPECLEAISEFAYDDYPEYLDNKLVEYRESKEFDSIEMITISIENKDVDSALYPNKKVIPACYHGCDSRG
jgi:hypothetical protein